MTPPTHTHSKECLKRLVAAGALQALLLAGGAEEEEDGSTGEGQSSGRGGKQAVKVAAAVALSKMAALDVEVRQVIVEEGGVARFLELADVAQSVEVQRQAMEVCGHKRAVPFLFFYFLFLFLCF